MHLEAEFFLKKGISYQEYRRFIDHKLSNNETTGPNQSIELVDYTRMNVQRMNRLDKTTQLSANLVSTIEKLKGQYNLLVITEGWCGDAAQIVPVVDQLAAQSNGKIEMKIVFRDDDPALIDQHLTNGGRAIPILLFLDKQSNQVVAKWGPRPTELQLRMQIWKTESNDIWEISKWVHTWYAKDKTIALQQELRDVIATLH